MSSTEESRRSQYVKLNVGGSLHYTTIDTLLRDNNSMLAAMFSGRLHVKTDNEGWILIDRSGKHFHTILNFLRDGDAEFPSSVQGLEELLVETQFYCLSQLRSMVEQCLTRLRSPQTSCHGIDPQLIASHQISSVLVVQCPKLRQQLLDTSNKPVVVLSMNRYNNVFSYTNNSHDNLLRSIECLEKYALMFTDSVLFIKDVGAKSEQNEICEWSFYYRGYKLKNIDCIAIHYSSEKRLIKVEFNEPKIHEEMLLLLSMTKRDYTDGQLKELADKNRSTSHGLHTGAGASWPAVPPTAAANASAATAAAAHNQSGDREDGAAAVDSEQSSTSSSFPALIAGSSVSTASNVGMSSLMGAGTSSSLTGSRHSIMRFRR